MHQEHPVAGTRIEVLLHHHLGFRQGFQGQGIHIAVMDAGFQYLHSLGRLASLREHILGCYDFSDEPDSMFAASGNHGIKCLGLIGMKSGGYTGAATEAQFYVMRTEENQSESPKELDNLIAFTVLMLLSLSMHICTANCCNGCSAIKNSIAFAVVALT